MNKQPHKPGPMQLARFQKTLMPKLDDINTKIEYQAVFGPKMNVLPPFDNPIPGVQAPEKVSSDITKQISKMEKDFKQAAALKFDTDKLPLNLLSTEALNQTAAVLKFGAKKYAEHNWRAGFIWSRPLAAAMRHLTAFNDGEDRDPETGLSHLAHAACCIMFLLEFEKTHPHLDDRYKPNVPPASQST